MNPNDTGLPPVPYDGAFWRVHEYKYSNGKVYHYVQLMGREKYFFNLFEKTWVIKEQILLELSKSEIRKRAQQILDDIKVENRNRELLGDYPPKKLGY